uniref:TSSK6 activating cochaperone n=1 Tax=Macaca nemestrina TaxID=9545 RepID=A0A2K6BL36_MACNE
MEQQTSHPNRKGVCWRPCFPSLKKQVFFPTATFLNIQTTKPALRVYVFDHKPKECLGLLECMYANLQLQTQLAQQQMAILEHLQASVTQLAPGRGSNNSSLPALSPNPLLNHLPQFSK